MGAFRRATLSVAALVVCLAIAAVAKEQLAKRSIAPVDLNRWTYIHADDSRDPASGKRGDFGIGIADLNGDGYLDVASGPYFYRNPGAGMTKTPWPRVQLPTDPETGRRLDAGLLFSVTGKGPARDVLAQALPNIVWLHADAEGASWTAKVVARMPAVRHGNGRTIKLARIVPGNTRPDIVLSAGGGTYLLQIPDKPEAGDWPIMKITHTDHDEQKGIGIGDIDGDGHADLVLGVGIKLPEVEWWRNPGDGSANWVRHAIGSTVNMAKMLEVTDVNGDGRLDVVATDSENVDSGIYWFAAPADRIKGEWVRHDVARGYNGLDSLSVADMNHDGLPDIVIGETKDALRLVIYQNVDGGRSWNEHAIDKGKESHKGAMVADLDGDGDLDIVSIAYFGFKDLHVWRNDNGGAAPPAAQAPRGPEPGEVYREFASHQGGDAWRVTNPQVETERARLPLPNPTHALSIDRLAGAVRAEVILDRWGGHLGTKHPRIRFNGNAWLDVPPPLAPPGDGDHTRYYFQDNPVITVPLAHLKVGQNTFEGTTSHANPTGWGLWGLYSLILRVYYDPSTTPHPTGRIVSPADGATIGENPTIRLEASSPNGIARVDVQAWYDGYDENGDGVWRDWHGGYFQPIRGHAADLREHVGTLWRAPYTLTWDTRWVPDQPPRGVKIIARIQDSRGTWAVTDPATDLTLRRQGESVRLYRAVDVPPQFSVRKNRTTNSCRIPIAPEHDLSTAVEAGLPLRSWHGWDGHHKPFRLNDLIHPIEGKNHHYDYDIHVIPPSALRSGDNVFTINSDTEHHGLEVHWPGPALIVRFRTDSGL